MAKYGEYKIPLRGFSERVQEYDYKLNGEFFSQLNDLSDIHRAALNVKLRVKKGVSAFELNFFIQGDVFVPCDRCLDEMPIEIDVQHRLFVKLGKEYAEESDDVIIIPEDDGEINVVWFIYEFVALNIPLKRVHPPGRCNKQMSSRLARYQPAGVSGEDSYMEEESEGALSSVDPRWEALKALNEDSDRLT